MKGEDRLVILVAPNVGEQMGGEAMKALQIFQTLRKFEPNAIQITHERCEGEIKSRLALPGVHFVRDTHLSRLLWKSVVLRSLLNYWFSIKAVKLAEQLAGSNPAIIHQTEPNSPVSPRAFSKKHINVLGPINGNIYYPEIFRAHESFSARARRVMHMPMQVVNRFMFRGILGADLILSAGGERTKVSLQRRGCTDDQMRESLDCGIASSLLDRPRITHAGVNHRFVHFGRLVFHKGTSLIVKSLPKTKTPVTLDIVGRGPELDGLKQLVVDLALTDRVRFLDWYESHADLLNSLHDYRGVVLPSIEDANGIVVQEAMALGLPPICLDWGGPQLLVENNVSGYLVEPVSEEFITSEIAKRMDVIAEDGELAEAMSTNARKTARTWVWEDVMRDWLAAYVEVGRSGERLNTARAK